MEYVTEAFKIALLVTVGIIFVANIPGIIRFVKEHKTMNKNLLVSQVVKWVGVFLAVLGVAFYAGSFLAYIQGVITQIGILAVFGTLCLVIGIVLFIVGFRKGKKNQK